MRKRSTNNDGVLLSNACADDCADCIHGSVILRAGVQCLLMFQSAPSGYYHTAITKRPGVHATAFSVVHVGERGCEGKSSPFFGSSCLDAAEDDIAYHKQTVKPGQALVEDSEI